MRLILLVVARVSLITSSHQLQSVLFHQRPPFPPWVLFISVGLFAIRELIVAVKLPIVRIDRRIFLDIYALDEWIMSNKTRYTY